MTSKEIAEITPLNLHHVLSLMARGATMIARSIEEKNILKIFLVGEDWEVELTHESLFWFLEKGWVKSELRFHFILTELGEERLQQSNLFQVKKLLENL